MRGNKREKQHERGDRWGSQKQSRRPDNLYGERESVDWIEGGKKWGKLKE